MLKNRRKIKPPKSSDYLDFLIAQLKPYQAINVRVEWLWNKDKSYLLSLANRWLLFSLFKISIPLYKLIFCLTFIPRLVVIYARDLYVLGQKQFNMLGNLAFTLDPGTNFGPFLSWKIIEQTYSHKESMWNIDDTSFFFDAITNGLIEIIRAALKQWNRLKHDNKTL